MEIRRAEGRRRGAVRFERSEGVVAIADSAVGDGGVGMSAPEERDIVGESRCLDGQERKQERCTHGGSKSRIFQDRQCI